MAALVGTWERVRAWLESKTLLGARARSDPADFGGNGQILMRSIQWSCACVKQQLRDEDSEEGKNGERVCDLGEKTVNP
jgi:hypothetical protein